MRITRAENSRVTLLVHSIAIGMHEICALFCLGRHRLDVHVLFGFSIIHSVCVAKVIQHRWLPANGEGCSRYKKDNGDVAMRYGGARLK